jgi:hypothetical protein
MATFTPFPVPIHPEDTPLVVPSRPDYKCSGCGDPVPSGVHIHETISEGMVTGIRARLGPDGPVVHQCGVSE